MTEYQVLNLSGGMDWDGSAALSAGKQVAGVTMYDIVEILLTLSCEWQGGGGRMSQLSQLLMLGS